MKLLHLGIVWLLLLSVIVVGAQNIGPVPPANLPPSGAAGGDLSGTFPNPTVAKVNGGTPGNTCTNQFTRSINSSAQGTCASVANADLSNSSVTINGKGVSLGGTYSAQSIFAAPLSPAGTTSASIIMAGLNQVITPAASASIIAFVSMNAANSTINDGCAVQIRTGTGTAPTNGAAATGSQPGAQNTTTSLAANSAVPISLNAAFAGSVGVARWIDLGFAIITGGTCTLTGVSLLAFEQ